MKFQPFNNYYSPSFTASSKAVGVRSGSEEVNNKPDMSHILKMLEEGRVDSVEFYKNGAVKSLKSKPLPVQPLEQVVLPEAPKAALPSIAKVLNQEDNAAYIEANRAVSELYKKLEKCEGIQPKELETCWKTGLVLGGIGGGIMITALTLKLVLEKIKDEDPESYEKLKHYQWPVAIATDIYGLLFLKKAYQAWHRPLLKAPANSSFDILQHLAENGLVVPEMLTMLKQCQALLTETQANEKRFSPEVYQLIKEKAAWANRFLTFLVKPRSSNLSSPKLNLKSSNLALVNLAKEETIKKLNIKNLLPFKAKTDVPWYEQLIKVAEAPIDWSLGKLTGEQLITVKEAELLYNQAWHQKLNTEKSTTSDRYLSQINAEIEARTSSDFERGLIPTEKQVQSMVERSFPARLIVTPADGQLLTSQANNTMPNAQPLGSPEKEDAYTLPARLNLITAIWGSACQALLFPKPKQ